ncbi:MAG: cbb3-type cytochrome c oxidase subunit I [Limnochordaceae bacterium]|nr:cbb3-type cytochrome c oxidase subunit I [Limnochordaceae bacterium]
MARTWHLQLAIFWVATAWMAAGLFLAPALARSGQSAEEPRGQATWTHVLFGALLLVAAGSLLGEWWGATGRLSAGDGPAGAGLWWWIGHQGWEYLELGRLWQLLLIAGLGLWLVLVYRGLRRALKRQEDPGSLAHLLLYASAAIPVFYGFGLLFEPGTNWAIAEFWRWWVIHLWVEGIFEVFTLVVTAALLVHLGLVRPSSALRATYFQVILVMATGVIGTAHHYYFVGLPELWLALGATFSALEVVPLTLLGVEAYDQYRLMRAAERSAGQATSGRFAYAPVFWFLMATAFWNLVGAGILGFFINLPVVNYFEHGTFLTAAHGHAALMGVYGMLALALLVFVLRSLARPDAFSERAVRWGFWGLNLGLAGMVALTLIPVGIGQLQASAGQGFAFARDPAFYQTPWVHRLLWLRMLPDSVFIVLGVVPMLWATVKGLLHMRPATAGPQPAEASGAPERAAARPALGAGGDGAT